MRTCVLCGDSHLSRFTKPRIEALEAAAAPLDVYNAAVGGWNSADLARKAAVLARLRADVVVISVGANDAAPWKLVPVPTFELQLQESLRKMGDSSCLVLIVPPMDEAARPPEGVRSNAELAGYRQAAVRSCHAAGATVVDVWPAFAAATERGEVLHDPDGTHLNVRGYEIVIDVLAGALEGSGSSAVALS